MGSDRQSLQDVMLRYAAGVDDRNFEIYRSCFADDVAAGTKSFAEIGKSGGYIVAAGVKAENIQV